MTPRLPLALLLAALWPAMATAGLLPPASPYVESGGIVQGEAENYHALAPGNGDAWAEVPPGVVPVGVTFENATGAGGLFLQAKPDDGAPNTVPFSGAGAGPSVDYKIQITTTGTYRLYLRWDGHNGDSDSIYAGIVELADGIGGAHADWYEDAGHVTSDFGQQNWDGLGEAEVNTAVPAQNPMTFTFATTGTYTLRVVAREDGVALDAFRLQFTTLPDPNPVAAPGSSAIIGQDEFAYADGAIAGRNGGVNFDFDNTTNNGGFIGFTRQAASTWDAVFGTPSILAGKLTTLEAGAKREYGSPSEFDGAVNDAGSTANRQVYYRVEMTRAAGATWTGVSSYDFANEHVFFGVPFNVNPATGVREFGIEQGGVTYSGVPVASGVNYTLVAKVDFVNDVIALYVNPNFTLPEEQNTPVALRPFTSNGWSTAVRLGSGGAGAVTWDNLIVGTSWGALQRAYPANVPVTGPNVVVGAERFNYAGGNIVGRDGGTGWDFDNDNGDSFVGRTQIQSTWDNVNGFPYVDGERQSLATWDSSAKREYGSPGEANGTFSAATTSQYQQLYYRFEMTRSGPGVSWSGVSAYEFNTERLLFGVPFAVNPSSGVRELAIHNLATNTHAYTGIAPVVGVKYHLVAKMDFLAGTVALFVNPDFTAAEPPVPNATLPFAGGATTAIRFGSGGSEPVYWDDVAVTTSWAAMQGLYPSAVPAPGPDVLVGTEDFNYANGGIGGRAGGAHWDFENLSPGDGAASHTLEPSNWDGQFGEPTVTGGILYTQDSGALRQYNSTEADGGVNEDADTVHKQVYYRFEMTRQAGATWSGASFFDFGAERILVGVPFATNPASGNREFAIHDLAVGHTYSGIQPVANQTYTIVAKLDFVANLISLWVNPDLAQPESANPPTVTRPYTGLNWNTAIRLGSGGSSGTAWDNVAVSTSWRTVQSAFGPPLAMPDTVSMRHNQKILLDVKRNDAGAGTVEIVTPPSAGTAVLDSEGRIRYQHTTGTPGSDSMSYRLVGISGQNSTPTTVTFNFSAALRLPNTTSTVPLTPPGTGLAVVDALPGVTMTTPTNMAVIPGTNKLIVSERTGKIWLIPDVASPAPVKQLFMDLAAVVNPRADEDFHDDGNEMGLKGIAFHPAFASNRQFFVTYNLRINGVRHVRLARFTAMPGDLNTGDGASEQPFITQLNDETVHNIGTVRFGPDGYLYFICGDEGFTNGVNNSQRIDLDFWSAIFRIDVDRLPANLEPNVHPAIVLNAGTAFYKVPVNNPFIGATTLNGEPLPGPGPVRTEIYALGFRNPWQFQFDSQAPHEMWVGDVGAELWEEVNVVTPGSNHQWAYKEGNAAGWKPNPPSGFTGTPPVWTYPHTNSVGGDSIFKGNSVTGGVVYRGAKYPSLTGKYVFADFVSGHIWTLVRNGANPPTVERIGGEAGIVAFEFDPSNGDILMLDYSDGKVRRLTTTTVDNTFPAKLSDTGLFADLTDLTVNPGIEPYEINLPFWSDFARKSRWFTIPDGAPTFGYVQDDDWSLPTGAIWIKHFDMEMTRGNSATAKRIETRLLVKNAAGSYGVSYRWNDAGTEAYLVDDNGADFDLNIIDGGSPYTQHWRIPSRSECLNCHTPQGGHALSWDTRQLNRIGSLGGISGNFISLLNLAGYLDSPPSSQSISSLPKYAKPDDTSHTLETRARSWLAVNCSYCHQAGGTGLAAFDLRAHLPLSAANIIDGPLFNSLHADHKAIVRGQPASSVILSRMAASNGYTRMPPLATAELDPSGIQAVTDWINESVNRQTYTEWRAANFGNTTSPEGEQTFDADFDGQNNRFEFLGSTGPLNGASVLRPTVSISGGMVTVQFPNLQGRLVTVFTSTDLGSWLPWNVTGNNGLPLSGAGTRTFVAPLDVPKRFFRLEITEQ